MPLALRLCVLVVDLGFLACWAITLAGARLCKDHHDPILHAWNWSFLPRLLRRARPRAARAAQAAHR